MAPVFISYRNIFQELHLFHVYSVLGVELSCDSVLDFFRPPCRKTPIFKASNTSYNGSSLWKLNLYCIPCLIDCQCFLSTSPSFAFLLASLVRK